MMDVEKKEEKEVEEIKMVEIKDLKNDKYEVVFNKSFSNGFVNTIRRVIMDEVPTFAIEFVEITENDSSLYDETIAQRLGLIPLKTDLNSYNLKEDCKCKGVGCSLCEVNFELEQEEEGYVYSSKLVSDDKKIVPTRDKILITKLFKEQKLILKAKAILGLGKEHSKWSPAHAYLKEDKSNMKLILETFGQLEVKEILNKSFDILINKLDELNKKL